MTLELPGTAPLVAQYRLAPLAPSTVFTVTATGAACADAAGADALAASATSDADGLLEAGKDDVSHKDCLSQQLE